MNPRFRLAPLLPLLALCAPFPALAATSFAIQCEDGSSRQMIREGTGTREQSLGMGATAMWCPDKAQIQNHRIGLEGDALDTLRSLAALDAGDEVLIIDRVAWRDDDTPKGEATRSSIGFDRAGTFGKLRERLRQLAEPVGYVEDTGFRTYRAAGCGEPLIPIRYYINTKAPFPGCGGGRLVKESDETTSWE